MLNTLQLSPITDTIARRPLGLFGHVSRMWRLGLHLSPSHRNPPSRWLEETTWSPSQGVGSTDRRWLCVRHSVRPTCDRSRPRNDIGATGLRCPCVLKEGRKVVGLLWLCCTTNLQQTKQVESVLKSLPLVIVSASVLFSLLLSLFSFSLLSLLVSFSLFPFLIRLCTKICARFAPGKLIRKSNWNFNAASRMVSVRMHGFRSSNISRNSYKYTKRQAIAVNTKLFIALWLQVHDAITSQPIHLLLCLWLCIFWSGNPCVSNADRVSFIRKSRL